MPKVSRIQENQRLSPQNPTGFQSTSQARLLGRAIASVGDGVKNLSAGLDKADKATRALAAKEAQYITDREMSKVYQAFNGRGYSEESYNQFQKDRQDALKRANEKVKQIYGDNYEDTVRVAINDASVDWEQKADAINQKKRVNFIGTRMKEVESELNGRVLNQPERIDEFMVEGGKLQIELGQALGKELNKNDMEMAERDLAKRLATSAVEGYIQKGNYKAAKDLVSKSKYSELFDTNETRSELDRITKIEQNKKRFDNYLEDKREQEREEQLKKASEKFAAVKMQELADASKRGDGAAVSKIMDEVYKRAAKGNLTFSAFGQLRTAGGKEVKQASTVAKMQIRKRVYNGSTPKDFQVGRNMIQANYDAGNLTAGEAAQLYKEFDAQEKSFTSDPIYKLNFKKAQARMARILGDDTKFDALTRNMDENEKRKHLYKMEKAKEIFYANITAQASQGKKPDPDRAAIIALDTVDFGGVMVQSISSVTGAPNFPTEKYEEATPDQIAIYIRDLKHFLEKNPQLNPLAKQDILNHIDRHELGLQIRTEVMQMQKDAEARQQKEKFEDKIIGIEKAFDDLMEPDSQGIPYIERLGPVRY